MIDPNHNINENFRQIEDIIDARKLLGQYNVHKQSNGINFRYIYSSSIGTPQSKNPNFEDASVINDRDIASNFKQTDSEITLVRVRCDDVNPKSRQNKWDMHDIAIPGDGSHLGESPSLVNLATLVGHNVPCEGEEYLVPLSSWDPYLKTEDIHPDLKCCSETNFDTPTCSGVKHDTKVFVKTNTKEEEPNCRNEEISLVFRRRSWAGKFSKFIRKHCKKSKTLLDQKAYKNPGKMINYIEELYEDHHVEYLSTNGTTASETLVVILPSFFITFIVVLLNSLLFTYVTVQKKWQFVVEYMFLVVPAVLGVTVLAGYLNNFLLTLAAFITILILFIYKIRPSKHLKTGNNFKTSFLTNARASINFLSVIAILGVDFKIFPRHFSKTQSFGYSLMDVGVGLFMYANGIVAPEARGKPNSLKKSLISSLPIFIIGILRFFLVQQTGYSAAVAEYGVHWNFFITLGVTKLICAFMLNSTEPRDVLVEATILISFHEILLQKGVQEFTLSDIDRDDIITANREGLASVLGYVAIYLFSVYFGHSLHVKDPTRNKSVCLKLVTYSSLALITSIVLRNHFSVSRKLANSAYCFWVLFIGIFMTGLYYLLQIFLEFLYKGRLHGIYSPLIFEAINYNGLVFFLAGNVLTGLINLTFSTLSLHSYVSLTLLLLYMFANCFIVALLYCTQIKLKF